MMRTRLWLLARAAVPPQSARSGVRQRARTQRRQERGRERKRGHTGEAACATASASHHLGPAAAAAAAAGRRSVAPCCPCAHVRRPGPRASWHARAAKARGYGRRGGAPARLPVHSRPVCSGWARTRAPAQLPTVHAAREPSSRHPAPAVPACARCARGDWRRERGGRAAERLRRRAECSGPRAGAPPRPSPLRAAPRARACLFFLPGDAARARAEARGMGERCHIETHPERPMRTFRFPMAVVHISCGISVSLRNDLDASTSPPRTCTVGTSPQWRCAAQEARRGTSARCPRRTALRGAPAVAAGARGHSYRK